METTSRNLRRACRVMAAFALAISVSLACEENATEGIMFVALMIAISGTILLLIAFVTAEKAKQNMEEKK